MIDGRSDTFLRFADRRVDRRDVVAVRLVDELRVPAVGFETLADVVGERDDGRTGQRDVVVVVEADQLAELEMAGERDGLLAMPSIMSPSPAMT